MGTTELPGGCVLFDQGSVLTDSDRQMTETAHGHHHALNLLKLQLLNTKVILPFLTINLKTLVAQGCDRWIMTFSK